MKPQNCQSLVFVLVRVFQRVKAFLSLSGLRLTKG